MPVKEDAASIQADKLRSPSAQVGLLVTDGDCRDGLERIEVEAGSTVGDLKQSISSKMGIPYFDVHLSKDKALVRPLVLEEVSCSSKPCCRMALRL